MSAARVELEPAYLLHRREYRESSLLVELFTPQYGRLGVMAKGARRASNRLAGVLQPFRPLLVSWAGRGELPSLAGAESAGPVRWLEGPALASAFYLNELLMRLLHRHDPHPELYAAYAAALEGLARERGAGVSLEGVLRVFEKRLLENIGYGLLLEYDADAGAPIEPAREYVYNFARGPVSAQGVMAGRDELRVRGADLLALAREVLEDPVSLRAAKHLTRAALAPHLGPRPLHSRRLFTAYRGNGESENRDR